MLNLSLPRPETYISDDDELPDGYCTVCRTDHVTRWGHVMYETITTDDGEVEIPVGCAMD